MKDNSDTTEKTSDTTEIIFYEWKLPSLSEACFFSEKYDRGRRAISVNLHIWSGEVGLKEWA